MTSPTIHDRVQAAIHDDALLHTRLADLNREWLTAQNAERGVRARDPLEAETARLQKIRDDALRAAVLRRDAAIADARKPMASVTAIYERAEAQARAAYAEAEAVARTEHDRAFAAVKRDSEVSIAMAQATTHRANQELKAVAAAIDLHRKNIRERLGINLADLLAEKK